MQFHNANPPCTVHQELAFGNPSCSLGQPAVPPQLTESHQVTQFQLSLPHNDISTIYWGRDKLTKTANCICQSITDLLSNKDPTSSQTQPHRAGISGAGNDENVSVLYQNRHWLHAGRHHKTCKLRVQH